MRLSLSQYTSVVLWTLLLAYCDLPRLHAVNRETSYGIVCDVTIGATICKAPYVRRRESLKPIFEGDLL